MDSYVFFGSYLNLDNNFIPDLSPLYQLSELTFVSVKENQLTDVEALKTAENLEELYLGGNKVEDLGPLKKFKSLKALSLNDNPIHDLAYLDTLEAIEELGIKGCFVEDYQPLSLIPKLKSLDLRGCKHKMNPTKVFGAEAARRIRKEN